MKEQRTADHTEKRKGEAGMVDWKNKIAKKDVCADCGQVFVITMGEFIDKLQCGMRLPKRCKQCRTCRRRQRSTDPYEGLGATFSWYPLTRGHRHTVHGGKSYVEQ